MEGPSDLVPRGGAGSHETQQFMAQRMRAKVRSCPVDHTPIVTAPSVVVDIIREAIDAVVAG